MGKEGKEMAEEGWGLEKPLDVFGETGNVVGGGEVVDIGQGHVGGGSETSAGLTTGHESSSSRQEFSEDSTTQEGSQDQGNHAQGQGKEGIHVA